MNIEKKVITSQAGHDHMGITNFLISIEEANKDGFFVSRGGENEFCGKRYGAGYYSITLVKGSTDEVEEESVDSEAAPEVEGNTGQPKKESPTTTEEPELVVDVTQSLGTLTKKAELLDYVKDKGYTLPAGIKQPAAIKKWLQKKEAD